jgi:hypothetical protein
MSGRYCLCCKGPGTVIWHLTPLLTLLTLYLHPLPTSDISPCATATAVPIMCLQQSTPGQVQADLMTQHVSSFCTTNSSREDLSTWCPV